MNFDEFLKSLSSIKNIPLPGEASHFKVVPSFRQELLKKQQVAATKTAKKAGVLALFYPDRDNQTKFILILRKSYKGVHSAQVAFPGGKLEPDDASIKDTAIRETYEEIGVPIKDIEVIKTISEIYIPPSNFHVHPFIGVLKHTPLFIKQEREVETLIEVSLKKLMNDNYLVSKRIATSYSTEVEVPAFILNGFTVWGATAMMLSEIKDILKQVL